MLFKKGPKQPNHTLKRPHQTSDHTLCACTRIEKYAQNPRKLPKIQAYTLYNFHTACKSAIQAVVKPSKKHRGCWYKSL